MTRISGTDLDVYPLCLGGNVFGWTSDEAESFAVLDAYVASGGNFVDTADAYSQWGPGHTGGESESVIGRWMRSRGNRDDVVVATKVGRWGQQPGLSAENVRQAVDLSLERLQTDRIDLYYAHGDDPDVPLEEALGVFDELVRAGKVRHVAASNYEAPRLEAALETSAREGLASYVALQPHYNLVERGYEDGLRDVCERHGLACFPYFSLAKGFLTGKYRPGGGDDAGPRAESARAYLDERGIAVLAALDDVAAARGAAVASVALAWLAAQPTVVAPIASARTPEQLGDLLASVELELSADDLARLGAASA